MSLVNIQCVVKLQMSEIKNVLFVENDSFSNRIQAHTYSHTLTSTW